VLAANGTVASYATDGGSALNLSIRELMSRNIRYQFVLVYTVPAAVKDAAVADVAAAAAAGVLDVGVAAGLPLHRFPLDQAASAHRAVEAGAVGKVLIDI
jgi:NADPH2:quinone reductase